MWSEMIRLIDNIENTPYVRAFWADVIEANNDASNDTSGTFVGEVTKNHEAWGGKSMKEWTPNQYGKELNGRYKRNVMTKPS